MRRAFALLITLSAGLAPARAASAAEVLPEVSLRLEAARYAPAERDLEWQGWIGAGAGLLRARGVTLWGRAEVETVLGEVIRPFEATQANYHLSFGLRRQVGGWELAPFFHHVSRHYVDRPKVDAVDWNLIGLRVGSRPGASPLRLSASLGRASQASLPGYEWEARAAAEAEARLGGRSLALLRGALRLVTVREERTLPRGDFVDWTLEGAVRWQEGGRALEAFLAGERRHDVFLEEPGARTRAVLGLRVLYEGR